MSVELTVVLRFDYEEQAPSQADIEQVFDCDVVEYEIEEV